MPGTRDAPPILSLLTPAESRQKALDRRWPKWSTQCLMHSLGLAVLDACLITPDTAPQLADAVEAFARLHDSTAVMIRSDGGIETTEYQRGGHTLTVEQAVEHAHDLLSHRRAVLLLEPANRFTNRLSAMIRIDRDAPYGETGQLTIEVLGPGYDLADLARSGVQPHARIEVRNIDWDRPEALWPHDVFATVVNASVTARLEARLDFIGAHCLPGRAALDKATRVERARIWLLERGYGELFEPFDLMSALRHLPNWHRDTFSIAAGIPHSGWTCVATGWSDLGDGRHVYWDIIDGRNKYG
ncbi:MAG: hypothetical protein QOG18_2535 [Microbacteriaceae bacterium]|jgi:hypothetical protein|nr:hypothetical protein [Mycobacterium sp.]MDQ1527922.1 hypothetical protein [Microbacteriaceae bacterium]